MTTLEPLYWKSEQLMGHQRQKPATLRGEKIDGGNPFEGPRQHEYPTTAAETLLREQHVFAEAVRRMGLSSLSNPPRPT